MSNIKKYKGNKNLAGNFIESALRKSKLNKIQVLRKLEMYGVYINKDELHKMEKNELMIKDFELVAIFDVLDIDLNLLKYLL